MNDELAADYLATRGSIFDTLTEANDLNIRDALPLADAILARLANLDPPIVFVRDAVLDERDRLRTDLSERVTALEHERDRLKAVVDEAWYVERTGVVAERDDLRAELTQMRSAVDVRAVAEVADERDRLRAACDQAEAEQDALAAYVKTIKAERDRLRAGIEPLRPYRVAIRANDEFFAGAGGLADAILGAVAALDASGDMGGGDGERS